MLGVDCCPDGEGLVVLGMAAAIQMAQGRSADELELLSSFFEVLGDNLALIAARRANCEVAKARCESLLQERETGP